MAAEWYVEINGQAKGPISGQRLKTLAHQKRITEQTKVRKGAMGHWTPAGRVKGLFDEIQARTTDDLRESVKPVADKLEPPDEVEATPLLPDRRMRPRLIVLACLIIFALIGPSAWIKKLFFCASMAFLLGTFPRYRVTQRQLEREMMVTFVSAGVKRWPFHRFEAIETDTEFRLPAWSIIFLGPMIWIIMRLLDYVIPWMGGGYKIWLRDWDRERIIAWQGNSEADFRTNLEILEEATGLPVGRR